MRANLCHTYTWGRNEETLGVKAFITTKAVIIMPPIG